MEHIDSSADLGYQANRLARLLRASVTREITPLDLTARQAAVVLQLADVGTLNMGELAERIGVDRPTLTGMVNRLERDGWLETAVNAQDRRSRLVSLTGAAGTRVGELAAAAGRAAQGALAALDETETSQLLGLLARASDGLEAALRLDPPTRA